MQLRVLDYNRDPSTRVRSGADRNVQMSGRADIRGARSTRHAVPRGR